MFHKGKGKGKVVRVLN